MIMMMMMVVVVVYNDDGVVIIVGVCRGGVDGGGFVSVRRTLEYVLPGCGVV